MDTSLTRTRYRIEGMDCASCATKIETAAKRSEGVASVSVSVTAGTLVVEHDARTDLEQMQGRITSLGYKVNPARDQVPPAAEHKHSHAHGEKCADHQNDHDHDHGHDEEKTAGLHGHDHGPSTGPWWRSAKGVLTLCSGAALVIAYLAGQLIPSLETWVFIAAMLVGLVPIARRAVIAAVNGTPFTIEMLMTIAAVGAVFIGAAEEGATVVFLFLVGELLEGVAAGRARASIQGLTGLVPDRALVERDGKVTDIQASELAVGDIIQVRPGDRVAADGEILDGESAINESPVTGESTPTRKGPGQQVFAGTINGDGRLRVRVSATAANNTIARVVKLVEEAQESKAPTERFIDRFSRYYTPGVVVVAALVAIIPPLLYGALWSAWIYKGLAILLIGCPCALVISTPAAIAAALSAGAKRGLLLKGGAVLELLGKITMVAFDKTGTLTEGKPKVTDVVAFGRPEADVLNAAAALEQGSSHPLALAIVERAKADMIEILEARDVNNLSGKGQEGQVNGETVFIGSETAAGGRASLSEDVKSRIAPLNDDGKTVSVVVAGDQVIGLIAMRDEPRADAKAGLDALKTAGIKAVMLTGDNSRTAAAVASSLGIEPRAQLLPEDKQRIVRELQDKGERVAKVGDGINDAPALAAADVGIAMGGGTDVALETADAAILHGRVQDVSRMVALSRSTMSNIHQNITIALGLKAVFLVTTILGITGLWPAILADTGATVLVTANAMRLLAWRGQA